MRGGCWFLHSPFGSLGSSLVLLDIGRNLFEIFIIILGHVHEIGEYSVRLGLPRSGLKGIKGQAGDGIGMR